MTLHCPPRGIPGAGAPPGGEVYEDTGIEASNVVLGSRPAIAFNGGTGGWFWTLANGAQTQHQAGPSGAWPARNSYRDISYPDVGTLGVNHFIEFRASARTGAGNGVAFRVDRADATLDCYYIESIAADNATWALRSVVGGVESGYITNLITGSSPADLIRIEVVGNIISAYLNGGLHNSYNDTSALHPNGDSAGLWGLSGRNAYFYNIAMGTL